MIGIFDSGSGGLTVLTKIRERIPSADILYFGDIKHAPYGSRTPAELSRLTFAALELLAKEGATSIVSACNSVSASLAAPLLDTGDWSADRLIEMVGPTVRYFKHADSTILLCATPATIQSEIYQNAFAMIGKEIAVLPIPDLAGAIEFGEPPEQIESIVRTALDSISLDSYTVLILACTHYPLVVPIFKNVLESRLSIFDPAEAVAERVEDRWWPREAGSGSLRFMISKDSEPFRKLVAAIFPDAPYTIEVIE